MYATTVPTEARFRRTAIAEIVNLLNCDETNVSSDNFEHRAQWSKNRANTPIPPHPACFLGGYA